jgi:hypothetical protein
MWHHGSPMIPIAMYNAVVSLGIEGIKYSTSPCQVVQNHFKIKETLLP